MTNKLRPAGEVAGDLITASCQCEDDYGIPSRSEEIPYLVPVIEADRAAVVDLLEAELQRPKRDYLTWYDLEQALDRVRERLGLPARQGGGG